MNKLPTDEETQRQKMLLRAFGEAFAKNREARSLDISEANRAEWIDGFNQSRCISQFSARSKYFDLGFWAGEEFMQRFFNNEG